MLVWASTFTQMNKTAANVTGNSLEAVTSHLLTYTVPACERSQLEQSSMNVLLKNSDKLVAVQSCSLVLRFQSCDFYHIHNNVLYLVPTVATSN